MRIQARPHERITAGLVMCIRTRQELNADLIQDMVHNVNDFVAAFNHANIMPESAEDIDVRIANNDDGDRLELRAMSKEAQKDPHSVPYCVCTIVTCQ